MHTGRITLCPFYRYNRELTISCEDVWHRYDTKDDTDEWMDLYCDQKWEQCQYAKALLLAYEEGKMDEHIENALREENRRLSSMIGREKKRVQSRDEEIRKLREKNHKLENLRQEVYGKYRKLQSEKEELDRKYAEDFGKIAAMYEDRICYLLDTYTDGKLREADVEEWANGKEFCLTYEGEVEDERIWIVKKKGDGDDPEVLQESGDEQ